MSDLISRQAAKSKAVYSHERHEKVVPVAALDWLPSVDLGKFIEKVFETLREMDDAVDVICNLDVDAVLDRMEVTPNE